MKKSENNNTVKNHNEIKINLYDTQYATYHILDAIINKNSSNHCFLLILL